MKASAAPAEVLKAPPEPVGDAAVLARRSGESRSYVRGSSLLFSGRMISLALNLAVQTLIVRSLSKGEYGAFAYGVGAASIASSAVLLGLDKAVSRFVAIFQERGDERKALGTVILSVGIVSGLGLTVILAVIALRHQLLGSVVKDPLALSLLLVLIVLTPIDALDSLLQSVAAIYVGPRAIFFRRHILGPGIKLAAVLLVMAMSGGVVLLGYAYVTGSLLGICLYATILLRAFRRNGGSFNVREQALEYPAAEVLAYSLPLLVSDVLALLGGSLAVVLLEYFREPTAVAEFRSVLPVARLNLVVLQSFSVLFIPLASRMFARKDHEGINELYWRTAAWVAVLTFPVFVTTFAFARPLSVLLFGGAYGTSGPLLAIMAVGFYFNAALGFNSYTFRICAPVRYMVTIDLVALVIAVAASVVLIQRFGALGAAIGTTATLVLRNVLTHVGLVVVKTGVELLDWRFLRVYALIAVTAVALVLVQQALALPIYGGLVLVAVASTALLFACRRTLQIDRTFPELGRIPLLRHLLVGASGAG